MDNIKYQRADENYQLGLGEYHCSKKQFEEVLNQFIGYLKDIRDYTQSL